MPGRSMPISSAAGRLRATARSTMSSRVESSQSCRARSAQKSASARGFGSAARSRTKRRPSAPSVKTISCWSSEDSAHQRSRVRLPGLDNAPVGQREPRGRAPDDADLAVLREERGAVHPGQQLG